MGFETAFFEAAAGLSEQLLASTLPEIAFSGKSNVGKSSMINQLLNRKSLARVSSAPGKTGTVNFYNLGFCRFVDLPGYGYAKVSHSERLRWAELVEGYFSADREIRLLVQLLDVRREPSADDLQMLRFAADRGIPCVVAATKTDKLNRTERAERFEALQNVPWPAETQLLPFSSMTAEGAEELRRRIVERCSDME